MVVGELDAHGALALKAVNACIQFLPTLDSKALFTVEDLRAANGTLHPVQQAMVDCHGSQCGFCTPGFVMSMWALYENQPAGAGLPTRDEINTALSGNLCRCTGYRPIVDAAQKMFDYAQYPRVTLNREAVQTALRDLERNDTFEYRAPDARGAAFGTPAFYAPVTLDAFARLRAEHPEARLVAGSTDIGLWVTKQFRDLGDMLYIGNVRELKTIGRDAQTLCIGAAVSLEDAYAALAADYPELAELWTRFASLPIRNAGTLGGNVANGSPIGDSMPALLALGAEVVLRHGAKTRTLALDAFYVGYQKTALAAGEFVAALAARVLRRPVKLRADRDDDFMITGKRHDAIYEYEAGFDDSGRILGARVEIALRAGYSADLSGAVATRAVCHFDNAYHLSDVDIVALCCKTNTQSNTAFRGFGGPQGALVMEVMLDSIARQLNRDPLDVRVANYYCIGERDTTPYGQQVEDNILAPLTDDLLDSSDYRARREALAAFNAKSPVLKRGLAFTPVKFGISFNVPFLNQAGALVHVYKDGSVLVNHGGTEMGQGLNTKVAQVVANEFGLPLSRVRVSATDTSKIANTSATAASTGSDLNGKAAEDAARTIRARLAELAARQLGGHADDVRFANGEVTVNGGAMPFEQLVGAAYLARVQLWSDGFSRRRKCIGTPRR
ncbi:MAG: Xanthine dehydrogenase, molybdenum binding subunit (EC [uncultured Paraburkholderia sp.]|nr:MAG: Xanthine dehydrogenase, molybdenum binding subunit (EC [uncultured Paraburkholderia sp.]